MKKGDRFLHSKYLSYRDMPEHIPLLFEITRISNGMVYYRSIHEHGIGDEFRITYGGCIKSTTESFNKYVLEWVNCR